MGTEGNQNQPGRPSAPATAVSAALAQKLAAAVTDEVVAFIAWQQSQADLRAAQERIDWLEGELRSVEETVAGMRSTVGVDRVNAADEGG